MPSTVIPPSRQRRIEKQVSMVIGSSIVVEELVNLHPEAHLSYSKTAVQPQDADYQLLTQYLLRV